MKIYFAGPLFSEADRNWIRGVKKQIEKMAGERGRDLAIIWPYELITQEEIDALGDNAKQEVFHRCKSALEDSDLLIALLDGPQVDDGTAWEVGYFYRKWRDTARIIGVRTDFRNGGGKKLDRELHDRVLMLQDSPLHRRAFGDPRQGL